MGSIVEIPYYYNITNIDMYTDFDFRQFFNFQIHTVVSWRFHRPHSIKQTRCEISLYRLLFRPRRRHSRRPCENGLLASTICILYGEDTLLPYPREGPHPGDWKKPCFAANYTVDAGIQWRGWAQIRDFLNEHFEERPFPRQVKHEGAPSKTRE